MTVMSLTVFLVTGGVLAFFFLGFLALIGRANRLHAQRQLLDRPDHDGPRWSGAANPAGYAGLSAAGFTQCAARE